MSDIVERLRADPYRNFTEAIEEIYALRAEIERLRGALEAVSTVEGNITESAAKRDAEIERLRELLRDARDDVAECASRDWKPHRIEAYKKQLAAIDEALGGVR